MTDKAQATEFGGSPTWSRWLVRGVGLIVLIYLGVLIVQVALRCAFPWDLFMWAESPFMTDMLKLDSGKPVFGPPEDGNSFVYSPGLTYLAYVLLKPLGLHLDIRYCRVVAVVAGLLAGVLAGLGARRALQMIAAEIQSHRFVWLSTGLAVLVIFKNFTADATHSDNLVMFHTAGLLLLTLNAVHRRSLGWAMATMLFSALGVFAKQTLSIAFIGPALVFLRFKPCGWRNGLVLAAGGAAASGVALLVLWAPEFARFYTWEVLTAQKIRVVRLYWMLMDLLRGDRAMLAVLGLASLAVLWRTGAAGRKYLQVWVALGLCSVLPGAVAYVKQFGTWNNLIIYQLWLLLLVLPAIIAWLSRENQAAPPIQWPFNFLVASVLVVFVLALFPTRLPASRSMFECCATVQERVTADIKAGRRVLVAHGMMYQLRAGSREIPLDRANSVLELVAAGMSHRLKTADRIRAHYYDRLYLTLEDWYDPDIRAAIREHYEVNEVIPKPDGPDRAEFCRTLALIGECKIMSPRAGVPAAAVNASETNH